MAAVYSIEAVCYASVQVLRPVIISSSQTWLRTATFFFWCSSYINLLLMNVRALPFAIAALTGLIEPLLNYLPREEAENLWSGFTALPINQVQNSLFFHKYFSPEGSLASGWWKEFCQATAAVLFTADMEHHNDCLARMCGSLHDGTNRLCWNTLFWGSVLGMNQICSWNPHVTLRFPQ